MSGQGTHRRSERGAAAVEFALVLLPLLYLVFGTVAYAYMFSFRQALTQAAAEGARSAVGASVGTACPVGGPYSAACPAQNAAATSVGNALTNYGMTCGTSNLTCSITAPTATGCAAGHTCVTVTASYPYSAHTLLPSLPGFGFVLPNSLTFTSVVQVS